MISEIGCIFHNRPVLSIHFYIQCLIFEAMFHAPGTSRTPVCEDLIMIKRGRMYYSIRLEVRMYQLQGGFENW